METVKEASLIEKVFNEGKAEGRRIEAEAQTIKHLQLIIQALHCDPNTAMNILQVPRAKRKSYQAIFASRMKQKPEKYR